MRTRRALALLTALCCFWMSTVGSLQHFHGVSTVAGAHARAKPGSQLAFTKPVQSSGHPAHCLVCEWQANSVSAALPVFTVTPAHDSLPLAVAVESSYVRLLAFRAPSRAPPAV